MTADTDAASASRVSRAAPSDLALGASHDMSKNLPFFDILW